MTEISYLTPGVKGFRDRSAMLLVVGILFVIAGAICGCLAAAMPMAAMAPQPAGTTPPRPMDMVAALFMYAALCAVLLTLGIGCVRKRRWVRPLIIVSGWIGLTVGAVAMIMWSFALPQMPAAMRASVPPGTPAPPPAVFNVMVVIMTVLFAVIYVIIPATLLWLFRSPDVQATLEHYDLSARWTDAVPIPVLGLCAMLVLGALWSLVAAMQGWFLAFGIVMTGAAARVTCVFLGVAFAVAAALVFRLRPAGWWIAIVLFAVLPVAWITTLLRVDITHLYRAMGMQDAELAVMRNIGVFSSTAMAVGIAAFAAGTLGFTLRVRRYFAPAPPPPPLPLPPLPPELDAH